MSFLGRLRVLWGGIRLEAGIGKVRAVAHMAWKIGLTRSGFSPDPYLTGVAMEETISGIQGAGVQATSKHYIGNEQETQRNPSRSKSGKRIQAQSVNLDDRTIHELYLWPFANSVRAGTASIMCSYQRLNGSYGCESSKALNGILKDELNFQGYVMSDWGAIHTADLAIRSGLDMAMPSGFQFLASGLNTTSTGNVTSFGNGSATIESTRIDDMILRIMTPYFHLNQDDEAFPTIDPLTSNIGFSQPSQWKYDFNLTGRTRDVRGDHGTLIREGASSGTVLLKNTKKALPLNEPRHIAVFGNDAGEITQGPYTLDNNGRNGDYEFGTLAMGGGSGAGRFSYLITPLEAIKKRADNWGGLVSTFLDNKALLAQKGLANISPPPSVCLVFIKSWAAEGKDRPSLRYDWNGTELVERVASYCNNTVVVAHSGGINVIPFANHPNVTAILAAHLPGQESGNSIADIIWGDVNPSGRLPYTIAHKESDYNVNIQNSTELLTTEDPEAWQEPFSEGLLIDYRYFDAANKSVLYEFGYGLSYTTFSLTNLTITKASARVQNITSAPPAGRAAPGGLSTLWDVLFTVHARVTNTGTVDGHAVPQLYVALTGAPAGTPVRQLRDFDKVELSPRQSRTVTFSLMRRDISYWDTAVSERHPLSCCFCC